MTDTAGPRTKAGREFHDDLHAPGGAYEQVTGRPECGELGCGSLSAILAIEQEARRDSPPDAEHYADCSVCKLAVPCPNATRNQDAAVLALLEPQPGDLPRGSHACWATERLDKARRVLSDHSAAAQQIEAAQEVARAAVEWSHSNRPERDRLDFILRGACARYEQALATQQPAEGGETRKHSLGTCWCGKGDEHEVAIRTPRPAEGGEGPTQDELDNPVPMARYITRPTPNRETSDG